MNFKEQKQTQIYAFGTVLLWASAFVFTKIALEAFSAPVVGALRYIVASLFYLIVLLVKRIGLPDRKDIPVFLLSGALGFSFYMIMFNEASRYLSSATGSIIIATAPVITALLANAFFRERLSIAAWSIIGVEFCGILVLTLWDGILSVNKGIFWMLGAALCISSYNLIQRKFTRKYSALQSTAYSILAGTLLLLFYLPSTISQLSAAPFKYWVIAIYMGIFPSAVAYLFWSKALSIAENTSQVTNFMFVTPLLATIMGFLVRREVPGAGTIVGGVIIIVGLLTFQKIKSGNSKSRS